MSPTSDGIGLVSALVAMLVCAAGSPAYAQQVGAGRPYRGLFGGGVGDAEQLLTTNLSAGGGYFSPVGTITPAGAGTSSAQVGGTLAYAYLRPRISLQASASTLGRYASGATWLPASHVGSAAASFQVPMSSRASLTVQQTFTYRPLHIISPFPGVPGVGFTGDEALLLDAALASTSDGYAAASSGLGLSYQISRRNTVSFNASYLRGGLLSPIADLSRATAGGYFGRALTRGLSVRLGYGITESRYHTDPETRFRHHNLIAGVDFDRALSLSLSRHTTASFSVGSTVLTDRNQTRFHVTGRAGLHHEIGRSWNASATYIRGVDVLGGVGAPVLSDAVTVGFGGLIGRLVQFHSAVGAALGNVGVATSNRFRSSYATTGITVGLTRYAGMNVSYTYYRSTYRTRTLLAPGVTDQFDRQSVRASLTLWAPLLYRARR